MKARAIAEHDRTADAFRNRYLSLEDDPYRSGFTYGRKKITEKVVEYLRREGVQGGLLLDAGCGTGYQLKILTRLGFQCVGLDGSARMLDVARENADTLVAGDVEGLPFPDATFDAAVCIEVLRYMREPRATLKELYRVLKPGGVCIATAAPLFCLNGYPLMNILSRKLNLWARVFCKLPQTFSLSWTMRPQAESAGFSHTEVVGCTLIPIPYLDRVSPGAFSYVTRMWEPADDVASNLPVLKELASHFILFCRK